MVRVKYVKPERVDDRTTREYRPIDNHYCSLPIAEDFLSMYLNNGYCVSLRRTLKQQMLVSEKHPKTKQVFRSSLRVGMEKNRHLRYYYWTIHPFSMFRFYWEIFIAVVYFITIVYMPIYGLQVVNPTKSISNTYHYHLMNILCISDMVVTCFSGYHNKKFETVVLSFKQIFKNYLCGVNNIFFDFIAALPLTYPVKWLGYNHMRWYVTINRYLRVLRLFTAVKYFDNFFEIVKLDNHRRILIKRIIIFFVGVEYATYFTYISIIWMIRALNLWYINMKVFFKMAYCTLNTLFHMKPIHFGCLPERVFILILEVVLLHFGNLFNAFLLAMMLRFFNRTSMVLRKHEYLTRQVSEYAKFKELPASMDKVLLQFVDFKFGRRIYNENLILSTLTPHMRDELFFLYSQKLVENVQLFKDMPTSAMKRIAVRLKPEILLPNDVIIQAGLEGSSMYFIIAGVVAVYTITGKEVCHLTDGANFGEIALLMNETRTASIVAADFCELFKLNRKDFQEAIDPFPELKERMVQIARERYTTILSFPEKDDEDIEEPEI